jgi:flagellar basal body-associated protein FliL
MLKEGDFSMDLREKIKSLANKNKKTIMIGGTVILSLVGTGICYVFGKSKRMSFSEWLKMAPKKELEEAYEKLRLNFCKTGVRTYDMEQISRELGERGAKEWFEKHPKNMDPNFRWTDANRWDKD